MIQGVIFDLDNTLLQSRHGAFQGLGVASFIIARQLRKHGYGYSQGQILKRLREIDLERRAPASGFAPRILYDRDGWWNLLLTRLGLAKRGGPWVHKTTLRYWDAYVKASPPFWDAEKTVKRLKRAGYRLALVSDSDGTPGMKRRRIRGLSFRELFEFAVVAGEDTPRVKPSRAPFLLAAKRLGIPAKNCVYVGDNPETDVDGAKAAGMTTVLVKRRLYAVPVEGKDPPHVPTFEVRSLREIPKVLVARKAIRP